MNRIDKFFLWVEQRLDEGGWVRRSYLFIATGMTWRFTEWAMNFSMSSPRPGADVSMIIAAIGVPLSAVTGFAFTAYLESRRKVSGDYSATTTSTVEVTK